MHAQRVDEMQNTAIAAGNGLLLSAAAVMSYTGLPLEPMAILTFLVVVDTITGVGKSIYTSKNFATHRLNRGVAGKLGLIIVPFVLALTAKAVGLNGHSLAIYALNIIILSESYSIVANIYTIQTRKDVPEWDAMSMLLRKIKDVAEVFLGKRD